MISDQNYIVFNWNVRGLNSPARRQVVKDLVSDHKGTVIYLQDTKLSMVDEAVICATLGPQFLGNYSVILANGVRGGVIIACSQDPYELQNVDVRQYCISATIRRKADNGLWSIT